MNPSTNKDRLRYTAFAWLAGVLLLVNSAMARQEIVSSSPSFASISASATAPVVITFSQPLAAQSLGEALRNRHLSIHGNYYGYYGVDTLRSRIDGATLTLYPQPPFIEGEEIDIRITDDFDGQIDFFGRHLSFRVRNRAGILETRWKGPFVIDLGPEQRQPLRVLAADFDRRNPYLEVAVITHSDTSLAILRNDGGDQLTVTARYWLQDENRPGRPALAPVDLKAADFDGDGNLDLLIPYFDSDLIYVMWGKGDGTFEPEVIKAGADSSRRHFLGRQVAGVALLDLDENWVMDGRIDFAATFNAESGFVTFINEPPQAPGERVHFRPGTSGEVYGGAREVACAKFAKNELPALAIANPAAKQVTIFIPEIGGPGELSVHPFRFDPHKLAWANVTGDDQKELIVLASATRLQPKTASPSAQSNELAILGWDSNTRSFSKIDSLLYDGMLASFAVGNIDANFRVPDVERDRDLDLVVSDYHQNRLIQLINDGAGHYVATESEFGTINQPRSVVLADVNRDGIDDLLVVSTDENKIYYFPSRSIPGKEIDIDFGRVFVNTSKDTSFYMQCPVSIPTPVTLEWTDTANFQIEPVSFTLMPGDSQFLRIRFNPQDTIRYREIVTVVPDRPDPDAQPTVLRLFGQGIDAIFDIVPDRCDFPVTPPNESILCTLKVYNPGNFQLDLFDFELLGRSPAFQLLGGNTTRRVPARDSANIVVQFRPPDFGFFQDTLYIASSDSERAFVRIPLSGKGDDAAPVYCGPDTIDATEGELLCFIADSGACPPQDVLRDGCFLGTFNDADGERLNFRFEGVPTWIDSIQGGRFWGTPGEGDLDTTIRVIALKPNASIFTATEIYIRVTTVNCPPRFVTLPHDTSISENVEFVYPIVVEDCEDSTMVLSVPDNFSNLPGTPELREDGTNRWLFVWTPPFGAHGRSFLITFRVEEVAGVLPLAAEAELRLTVGRAMPDLAIVDFRTDPVAPKLRQTVTLTAIIENRHAPILASESFRVEMKVNGKEPQDRIISGGLQPGAQETVTFEYQIPQTGSFEFYVMVDADSVIAETIETNNDTTIFREVDIGKLIVRPNPFTPNGDNINDELIFDFSQLPMQSPDVRIFSLQGRLVRHLRSNSTSGQLRWDGRDESGKPQLPGVYLYILQENQEKITGHAVLAR